MKVISYRSSRKSWRTTFEIFADRSCVRVIPGTPLTCTMKRNWTRRHAERMHGLGIIWLAPLEACVFIRRWVGAAQLHWITSGNQPSWPELSAKCNLLPRSPFIPCTSISRAPLTPTLNFPPMSPCWPNSNVGCFACGNHECISRRLNSKYICNRDSRAKSRMSSCFWTINHPMVHAT